MQSQCTKNGHPVWTPEEDAFITDNFRKLTIKEMSQAIGRTEGAIRNRRLYIGASGTWKFQWTPDAIQAIRDAYADRVGKDTVNQKDLAHRIGCTIVSLQRKVRELGLAGVYEEPERPYGVTESGIVRYHPLKYETDEERRRAVSERTIRQWKEFGHPRGALGMKHTPEALEKISLASRRHNQARTPEQVAEYARRAVATKLERYGVASVSFKSSNPYSRARGGHRQDIGIYVRSRWEANYARYLNHMKSTGEIQDWEYEPDTFRFHGFNDRPHTYTPDFRVTRTDGGIEYHEVKGWMDQSSKERLHRMATCHPDIHIIVIGEPEYKRIVADWSWLEHWEG